MIQDKVVGQDKSARPLGARQRAAVRWIVGLAVSGLVANALCLLFTNSTDVFVWDEVLDYAIRRDGQVHRHRTEGWADTQIGRYAVNGIADITELEGPKVIFWGDSHVEGFSLADQDKVAQQFNRLTHGSESLPTAFAVGLSGTTIGTAAYLLPKYEELAAPVVRHVFVITRLGYVLPEGGPSTEPYSLRSHPKPHFDITPARRPDPRTQYLLELSRRAHLPLPYQLLRRLSRLDMRFQLGGLADGSALGGDAGDEETDPLAELEQTWGFLIGSLAKRARAPISFVYCPAVPHLADGKVVFEDPDQAKARLFDQASRRLGVPFLDLSDDFADLYRTRGTFPRGFANSNPYRGHLNEDGTRLLAGRVASFLDN